MTNYVALLRAVNVGGTGKLPMADLKRIAEEFGFDKVRTYIASGNLLFSSDASKAEVRSWLERALKNHMGKPVTVMVRNAAEMERVVENNPFKDAPGQWVLATFLADPAPSSALDDVRYAEGERIGLGKREIYVDYCGKLLGRSKLKVPAAATGTARNMNTVAELAELAKETA